jgi:GntR family histidine utilization transcriptional repressor
MTLPLHERIRSDIECRILSGELPPGARLPTELELMQSYGCARMTVSKALSALGAAGLIDRRKRAGSFVARPRVHSMVLDIPDLAQQLVARGQRYRYQLLKREVRQRSTRDDFDVGPSPILDVRGLHLADETPLAVEHRLISLRAVPAAEREGFDHEPPGSWLLRHVPWTEAETRIAAIGADLATARLLGVETGTACLLIDRRTWRGEDRVTAVHQIFLGTAYDLVARFGPASERASEQARREILAAPS